MKATPKLITSDFQPDQSVIEWCNLKGFTSKDIQTELPKFIHWHEINRRRRADFTKAFKNWLMKSREFKKEKIEVVKKGSQSFKNYVPMEKSNQNKAVGRAALDELRRL